MKLEQNLRYFETAEPRKDLVSLIPKHCKRIFEVGVGVGYTGKFLRQVGFNEIVGIEINAEAGNMAR